MPEFIVGMLSKTSTNTMYVLQIGTKTMLVIVAVIIKVQAKGTKGRGRVQRIVLQRHQILL